MSDHPLGKLAGYVALITGALALLGSLSSSFNLELIFQAAGVLCALLLSGWCIREAVDKPTRATRFWALVIPAGSLLVVVASALAGEWGLIGWFGWTGFVIGVIGVVSGRVDRYEAEHTTCAHCAERIKVAAIRCKHCRQEVPAVQV